MSKQLDEYCKNIAEILSECRIAVPGDGIMEYEIDGLKLYYTIRTANNLMIGLIKQAPAPAVGIGKELGWAFAEFMKDWQLHSSGKYYYKSTNHGQWPPDETATKEELLNKFFPQ
jgi:hypothetical protein